MLVGSFGIGAIPATAATASSDDPAAAVPAKITPAGSVTLPTDKLAGGLDRATGRQSVFVQLSGQGAAAASDAAKSQSKGRADQIKAAKAAKAAAKDTATAVVGQARKSDRSAREMWQVGNAVPGVAINADMSAIRAIASRGDVVQILPLVPKHALDSNGGELTKVVATWQQTHNTGKGVKIAIIDTGIDYTHADLGGPGTATAWDDAHANNTDPNWRSTLTPLAAAKVAGGYDFSGDNYNADPNAADYQPVPHPDPNPIDCNGHGSHVAGIAAGYGENPDGSTFTGDYSKLNSASLAKMPINPGMAPAAQVYSLKVFGCTGSTDVVIPALDRTLDLNGDGTMVRADVVNLSLGSDYAAVDDPENAVVDALAKAGVVPVIAMGNNGDLTDTGGSPGNAVRSLAVASSVDAYQPLNQLAVTAPASVAGTAAGQVSTAYDWANQPAVTGQVIALSAANADGCDALSADDAAAVNGKVAWLTWDSNDSTRRCGSAARANNVAAVGGIGAVFTGDVLPFGAGILGSAAIPVFQLTPDATAKLASSVGTGLTVTFDASTAKLTGVVDPSITDLVSSFSSRGTHGSLGVVKPDVSAPGDTIISVGMGMGTGAESLSGTSMATPHTAGIAALVKAAHPDWNAEQIKADIMNTAGHDLWTGNNQSGRAYAPARDGAGRVDALAAVNNTLLAYADAGSGGVSASFGPVEASVLMRTVTKTRTVTLQNTGSKTVRASLAYDAVNAQPGVKYTVSPSSVSIRPHSSTKVRVTLSINPSAVRNTIDPTMEVDQLGVPRQFVADASGRLLVSVAGSGASPLRVPVYAAVKPVSATVAWDGLLKKNRSAIVLGGKGVSQGTGATAYNSLVSVMTLGAKSPRLPKCTAKVTQNCTQNETARAGDLQYVGAGSAKGESGNYSDGWLWFGISTYADWATVGNSTVPYVDIDTTGDGKPDFEVYVQNYTSTDVLLATLVDLHAGKVIDLEPVNFNWADVNTNVFDTNVLTIPVSLEALGVPASAKSFPISYSVATNSAYAVNPDGDIDGVGPIGFDVANPAISVSDPLYLDQGHTAIAYTLAAKTGNSKHGWGFGPRAEALVLHLHGASGHRAQVVPLRG